MNLAKISFETTSQQVLARAEFMQGDDMFGSPSVALIASATIDPNTECYVDAKYQAALYAVNYILTEAIENHGYTGHDFANVTTPAINQYFN